MKKSIVTYLKNNYFELFITFCLFSNLYPYSLPTYLYYVGIFLMLYKMMQKKVGLVSKNIIYLFFIVAIWLSTFINLALDFRLVLFTVILIVSAPFVTSVRWHLFKKKLMHNIYIGFACTVVLSLLAKLKGVNYQVTKRLGSSMMEYGGVDEFSGFAKFPMWNSAAAAVSMLFFAYLLFKDKDKNKTLRYFYILMYLASLYVCLISASRSAFGLAALLSIALLKWLTPDLGKMTKYIAIFACIGFLSFPFFLDSATRMLQKQEHQEITGKTSRDGLWAQREAEFLSSPVFGVGFAVQGVGEQRQIGRGESGSSWFSILAQTGLIGFVIAVILWSKVFTRLKRIDYDSENVLTYALFLFFTVHSILEGYMFQGGWYMCVICWLTVGIITEAKIYKKYLVKKSN